jgi:RNA polymerase sigma-70 factor (ECF subfamily)
MDILEKTDEELIEMVKKGDKEAFGIVVDRYLPKIKRYAKKFIFNREDIDDLVQDVFLKAYANVFSFDSDKKFSPWVYRIAHNEFVNAIKKKMREKFFSVDFDTFFPHLESKENLEEDLDRVFDEKFLDENLSKLDTKYKEIIILFFYENLTYQEISDILEIPVSTVGVRLGRAKEKLKTFIKKYNE